MTNKKQTTKRKPGRPKKNQTPKTSEIEVAAASTPYAPETQDAVEPPLKKEDPEATPDRYEEAARLRAESRNGRLNLGGLPEQKLLAPEKPGFIRRWVNDEGNRLADCQRKGYSFVSQDDVGSELVFSTDPGDKISQVVGTHAGSPLRAYLMEIPEGWHTEDAEEKEASRRETEKQIRSANHGSKGLSGSVMYDPNPHANHLRPPDD